MIHRLNVFLLSLIIAFAPAYVMAVDWPDDKPRNWYYYEMLREEQRLKVHLKRQINNLGSAKTIEAVVETKPTASKVGGSMMKRIVASPGGAAIGVYAVTELIEAIGWVMEEGTYVKKITTTEVPDNEYEYKASDINASAVATWHRNASQAVAEYKSFSGTVLDANGNSFFIKSATVSGESPNYSMTVTTAIKRPNGSLYNESTRTQLLAKRLTQLPPSPTKTVPLTPALLGAAMLGSGYQDPDPNFNNDTVNTDNWTGVPEAYTPDPSGVGNELADSLEDKADRAPKTPDGKAAPIGDPKYQDTLDDNDDANDRQWDGEQGTGGETSNTEKTDPVTGEKITEGTFNLPKFCDWAMTVCEWYEGWKKTDVKVNQHIDDTKQHQTEEKSFWQSVKDWFNWTKEDDLPEKDETDLKVETPLELQNYSVSWNEQCPESQTVNVGFHGIEKEITIINWAFVCSMDYIIKPAVIAFASLSGLYIILGTHRRESD